MSGNSHLSRIFERLSSELANVSNIEMGSDVVVARIGQFLSKGRGCVAIPVNRRPWLGDCSKEQECLLFRLLVPIFGMGCRLPRLARGTQVLPTPQVVHLHDYLDAQPLRRSHELLDA